MSSLWTVGEVHFLYKNAATFPVLERLCRRFQAWIRKKPVVWTRKGDGIEGFGYYLEESIRNVADVVYATPKGLAAIESGRYFIAEGDNATVIDRVCRKLRLRGVDCA